MTATFVRCSTCSGQHCCSVQGSFPPLCTTDPDGSLLSWMPWENEEVAERAKAGWQWADGVQRLANRLRISQLRRMVYATLHVEERALRYARQFANGARRYTVREREICGKMDRFRAACRAEIERLRGVGDGGGILKRNRYDGFSRFVVLPMPSGKRVPNHGLPRHQRKKPTHQGRPARMPQFRG